MNLREWDSELDRIQRELSLIGQSIGGSYFEGSKLARDKNRVIRAQLQYEKNLVFLNKIIAKDYPLRPKERALIHWGDVYLKKARKFYDLQKKFMVRSLWLKLLKARILGGEMSDRELHLDPDAADIVALGLRHAHLQKAEKHLKEQISKIECQKKELNERYQQLSIVEANNLAGRSCLSRFSHECESGGALTSLRTIGKALAHACLTSRHEEQYRSFATDLKTYSRMTEEALRQCQNVLLGRIHDRVFSMSEMQKDHVKEAVLRLTSMEAKMQESYENIILKPLPPLRPIIVQKTKIPAKTDSHIF